MKKATLVTLATITLMGASLASAKDAAAFWTFDGWKGGEGVSENSSGFPSLIQKIIDRFNLNEDEVEAVVGEYRQERHSYMEQQFEDRLTQAVVNSQLTEEQKQLLLDKHAELQAEKESWVDLSPEQRREQMRYHHEEMENWAEDNDIDLSGIMPFGQEFSKGSMRGFGHGMRGDYHMGGSQ